MPATLILEDGSGVAGANTWLLVASITDRMASYVFGTAWAAVDADRKAAAALESARQLARYTWRGTRATETQGLPFPRRGIVVDGSEWPANTIPEWLLDAQARQANHIASLTETPYSAGALEPRTELKVGSLSLTPSSGSGVLSPDVRAIIAPYLSGSAGSMDLVRC